MKTLSSLILVALCATATAQPMDPYRYSDPDLQEAAYWHNLSQAEDTEEFQPAAEEIQDIDNDLVALIRNSRANAADVSQFTSRMASAEAMNPLGLLGGLLDPQVLIMMLLGATGIGGGIAAKKQHTKRKAAELLLKGKDKIHDAVSHRKTRNTGGISAGDLELAGLVGGNGNGRARAGVVPEAQKS